MRTAESYLQEGQKILKQVEEGIEDAIQRPYKTL